MKVARYKRRGLTLIEAVVSLVIISVLMLGLSSSVMLGVRALPDETELGAADREVQEILNTFRDDVSNASQILNQVSGNNIRLVLTMNSTGAMGEASSITYDILVDANMIR
ncbi:MAG: type II secretion system protein J, partial [Phycisphaerales bacterium]